jgi:iron complex outermembrane receptor protein
MMDRARWALRGAAALLSVLCATAALAEPAAVGEVVVVAPTPLAAGAVDADKLPGVVESIGGQAFAASGSLAVTDVLEQRVAGASLGDPQGNAFTRDFNFRGFQSSPLQGTPQGFAVYMGGVRLNEAFGDTVNWDLLPEVAIAGADLFTANPAFGLNALGGAISLRMKTGFDHRGGDATLRGGSFGRAYGSVEQGVAAGPWALYLAADGGHERGWRRHSPSSVARAYADLGWKQGPAEAHLVLAGASNRFGVVGPAPVDLLEADRRAVYTFPQTTRNNTGLVALNGRYALSGGWSLHGGAYVRKFNQHHVDGNDGDFEGCSGQPASPLFGTLCLENDAFPAADRPPAVAFQVQTLGGTPIGCPPPVPGQNRPCDGAPYGSIDRTRTDALTVGASVEAAREGELFGRGDTFAAGASVDDARSRFSSNSTLALVAPTLFVDAAATGVPGVGRPIRTAGALAYTPVEARTRTTYLGLYATDTWDATDRLSLTLSGRLNKARVETADLTGVSPELNGLHHFTRFNPAAGAAYRFSDAATAYGSYSEANRAPTALELGCSDPLRPCLLENALVADPPLKQVTARTWEAGLRGAPRLNGRALHWRIGVFQADNRNDILALASAIQGRGYYANVPKTRRRGFELSADYAAHGWTAYGGFSHIEATYRFAGLLPSAASPFADANGDVQVQPGDRIGGIPSDRFKAGGDLALTSALSIGADLVAVGPQYLVGDEANQDSRLPGYWTLGAQARWKLSRTVELFGRVDNVFDSRRATYGTYFDADGLAAVSPSPLPDDPDPRTVTPLTRRAFQIGLTASW